MKKSTEHIMQPIDIRPPGMAQNPLLNAVPVYEGECLSWLKSLPDKCCDIWTDPPYNVGKDYGVWNDAMPDAEYLEWITAVLIECKRVSNVFTVYVPKKWQLHYWNVLGPEWQEIILTYTPEGAIRSGFVNQFNKLFTNANPKAHKKYIKNVWHNIRERSHGYYFTEETYGHPGYTSELLSRKVILDLCVSDIICDPFMGTGTTAVASIKSGKDFIGCEINPEYVAIAKKRIEIVKRQPVLFEDGRHGI